MQRSEIKESDFLTPTSSPKELIQNETEVINLCQAASEEFQMSTDNMLMASAQMTNVTELYAELDNVEISDEEYWLSILTAMESCHDYHELVKFVDDLNKKGLCPLEVRNDGKYEAGLDRIDKVAQLEIPLDGPTMLKAIYTYGDGNCLCRSLSKAFFNHDGKHIELRA